MPTTTTRIQEHQERWDEIVRDPSLRDLPYKVETNRRGQIVLSPHRNRHSFLQEHVQALLDDHAPEGYHPPEFAIATPEGVKSPDVVWMSPVRRREMEKTGDPTTLAPEICVEVLSSSNTAEEIREKRALYLEAGAEEVWVVDEDGQVRFFEAEEEMDHSEIAEDVPEQV
jgi:Uma2 family endonuclease